MKKWIESYSELFFPYLCVTCSRKLFADEKYICLNCRQDLPRTNFHNNPGNKVAQLFWGRVELEYATAWLFFRKGSHYQRLVHCLKYKGMKELGYEMGFQFGNEIRESVFKEIDIVMPVPLHAKKEKKRGYNQSEWVARGISGALGKPLSTDNLTRSKFTPTQTRKNRFERWQNVDGIFEVLRPADINSKHILLVDDVVTTGSTLEAAAYSLLGSGAAKTSIVTLATADY
jgi:ComF family protein